MIEQKKQNYFSFHADAVNKYIDILPDYKICMQGVEKDILSLKEKLEELYTSIGFHLSYWQMDCGYHGWSWAKDDGSMKAQAMLTDGIQNELLQLYAMVLKGLGLKMKGDQNDAGEENLAVAEGQSDD